MVKIGIWKDEVSELTGKHTISYYVYFNCPKKVGRKLADCKKVKCVKYSTDNENVFKTQKFETISRYDTKTKRDV